MCKLSDKKKLKTPELKTASETKLVKMECQKNCERCQEKHARDLKNEKKIALLFLGLFTTLNASAQEAVQKKFWSDPFNHPMISLYAISLCVLILFVLAIVVTMYTAKILRMLTDQIEQKRAQKSGVAYVMQPSWWSRLIQRMNASVPPEQEKDIDTGHDFDGIRELDNYLPPWWKWLFYGTIAWSVVYMVVYHVSGTLPLPLQEYENEVALAQEQIEKFKASQPQSSIDENTLLYTVDAAIIEKGKAIFINTNCGACHRNDGGGNTIGPNLADTYWIYGGGIKNVFSTIKNGAVEKGMPAWGKSMSLSDVRDVAFFVMSLQGTNPVNAKSPQGEVFKETITVPDSTKAQGLM